MVVVVVGPKVGIRPRDPTPTAAPSPTEGPRIRRRRRFETVVRRCLVVVVAGPKAGIGGIRRRNAAPTAAPPSPPAIVVGTPREGPGEEGVGLLRQVDAARRGDRRRPALPLPRGEGGIVDILPARGTRNVIEQPRVDALPVEIVAAWQGAHFGPVREIDEAYGTALGVVVILEARRRDPPATIVISPSAQRGRILDDVVSFSHRRGLIPCQRQRVDDLPRQASPSRRKRRATSATSATPRFYQPLSSHHAQQRRQRQAHEHHHDDEHVQRLQLPLVLLDAVGGGDLVLQLRVLGEYVEPP